MSTEAVIAAGDGGGSGEASWRMSIDDALTLHAGEFGRWQLRHFVLVSTAWALEALHTMVIIFADREPAMLCPAGDGLCGDRCVGAAAGWEWAQGSASSTVAEWGLVCGERYKVGLVQAIFFAGCMIGSGVLGHLSDSSLGRKGALQVACFLNAVFGLLTALSPNYWAYACLRFLTGFSCGSLGLCCLVLATEPIGPSRRGTAGISTFYFFTGGMVTLVGIAVLSRSSWRLLYVATSLPSFVFVLAVMPFVSESPRWYLVQRRPDEAIRVLRHIASTNGRSIPDDVTLKLDDERDDVASRNEVEESSPSSSVSIVDVFRSRTTRVRLVLSMLINFLCSVVYYGLTLSVVNLKTNLYFSVMVNSVAEMPAFLLTTMMLDRLGRKPLGISTMLLGGVVCTIASFIPSVGAMRFVRMACGVVGIFGMASSYNLLTIYSTELFPTVVRNAALGCTAQAVQMGAILAPMLVVLGWRVSFTVFGVSGITGGLLVFYLPETMKRPLYDTIAGLEEGEKSRRPS